MGNSPAKTSSRGNDLPELPALYQIQVAQLVVGVYKGNLERIKPLLNDELMQAQVTRHPETRELVISSVQVGGTGHWADVVPGDTLLHLAARHHRIETCKVSAR